MTSPEDRFTALVEQTRMPLLAYAVRRVADPSDAADVVAETYLTVWRRIEDVPSDSEARPWVFGVARRILANHHRGERRRRALADRLRESLAESASLMVLESSERAQRVSAALATLPETDREILRLVAWEQMARDDIAIVMGMSRSRIRVRLHRARKRLAHAMSELDDLPTDESAAASTGPSRHRAAPTPHPTTTESAR